jgi:hypothetical protein
LYGAAALNASLLGFGERTGNPPLEAAIFEYIGLTGSSEGIDTTTITDIADYYRLEIGAQVPSNAPFIGADFNVTRAGIHADGLLKNQEIYNIFDTESILKRPIRVLVTDKSGMAGIARWINDNVVSVKTGRADLVSKRHPGVRKINDWVSTQYANGRTTAISAEELLAQAKHYLPSLFESGFARVREEAKKKASKIADSISGSPEIKSGNLDVVEAFLTEIVKTEGSIQLLAITDTDGRRISQVHTQRGEKGLFRNLLTKDFRDKEWFARVIATGEAYYSDLFFSKYTGALIFTAALPLMSADGSVHMVVDIDFKFEELVKLLTAIPDEILSGAESTLR